MERVRHGDARVCSPYGWSGTRSAAVECPAVVSLTRGPHTCRPTCQWPNCRLPNCSGSLSRESAVAFCSSTAAGKDRPSCSRNSSCRGRNRRGRPARPVLGQRRRSLPAEAAEPKPRETPSLAQTLLLCFSRKKKLVPPSRRVAGPTNLGLRRLEACVHRGNGVAFSHLGHTGKKEPPRLSMCRGPWALLIVQSGKLF